MVVSGSYAYLAHSAGGLRIIDISNPQNPQLVGQVLESQMGNGLAYGVAVAGSHAYVANEDDGLRIINISNPQNPQLAGQVPESQLGSLSNRRALGVTVAGGYAYLANNNDGLRIIDISNPQNPQLAGHIPESQLGNANARQVAVAGNYAYIANYQDGLRIVNIGNGAVRTNEADILFRRAPDGSHGVGWYGTSSPFPKLFAGADIDGPVLYGYAGEALGGTETTQRIALRWNSAGKVGIGGRAPAANALEVEGNASKTAAGSWLANSDRRIKEDIQPIGHALETLDKVRLVDFRYTEDYRAAHPGIDERRYLNVVAQEFAEVFPEHVKAVARSSPTAAKSSRWIPTL